VLFNQFVGGAVDVDVGGHTITLLAAGFLERKPRL